MAARAAITSASLGLAVRRMPEPVPVSCVTIGHHLDLALGLEISGFLDSKEYRVSTGPLLGKRMARGSSHCESIRYLASSTL
ncbi:hypothetical protein GCM10009608_28900 [Pseudonocardia alaniniphila]